jgi:cell division initiation protein
MKITPLEIRQKTFEKAFRGLDKDEVYAYLTTLSQEWEKLNDQNKELKMKLENTQKEIEKLREVETSLFKTLKTAEDTGANMIDQATKAAKLHMRETEMKAETVLNDARNKAKNMIEEAELRSRHTIEEMEDHLKDLGQLYRTLENARADMISEIKGAAQDALERAERITNRTKNLDIEKKLLEVKKSFFDNSDYKLMEVDLNTSLATYANGWLSDENKEEEEEEVGQENEPRKIQKDHSEEKGKRDKPDKSNSSFFDDIE